MDAQTFWNHVKPLIKAQKTTQEAIAKTCGISFGTFQGWIARNTLPDVVQSYRMAAALGVSVEYLVTGIEPDVSRKYRDRLEAIKDLVNKPL